MTDQQPQTCASGGSAIVPPRPPVVTGDYEEPGAWNSPFYGLRAWITSVGNAPPPTTASASNYVTVTSASPLIIIR